MKQSELRDLIREVIEEELLSEARDHITNDPKKFRQWFPEISAKFFTNVKIDYLEIRGKGSGAIFRYEPAGKDKNWADK